MSQRTRGQEASLHIIVDGDLKGGSFAKVTDWKLTPRQDVTETDFVGETESDLDFQHHGWDVSFSIHNQDKKALDLIFLAIEREQNHLAHPDITIVATLTHRDPSTKAEVTVCEKVFLKADQARESSGRKDYVKTSFSGKCKVANPL